MIYIIEIDNIINLYMIYIIKIDNIINFYMIYIIKIDNIFDIINMISNLVNTVIIIFIISMINQ